MDIWDIDKVFLFVVLVLPGFISLKIYDLIIAGDKRDFSKSIVESIAYSTLNFAVLSWLIIIISKKSFSAEHEILYWISIVFIFVVCPIIWPFVYVWISKFKVFKKYLLSPINQPWDKIFSKRDSYWIIIHLKNGKTVRGKYATKSCASAFPRERQIYLEEVWREGKTGGFGKKIDRTQGMIIFESEISYVEFYK